MTRSLTATMSLPLALLLLAACGTKEAPTPEPADQEPAVEVPASPVSEASELLEVPIDSPEAVQNVLGAAERLAAWATEHGDHDDAPAARLLAARLHLVAGAASPIDELGRQARAAAELAAALTEHEDEGIATAAGVLVTAARAVALAVPETDGDVGALVAGASLARGDGPEAAAIRVAWARAIGAALVETRALPAAERLWTLAHAGRVCHECRELFAEGADLTARLLTPEAGAGLTCEAALTRAEDAPDLTSRAALLAACPELSVAGDGELVLGHGANAMFLALLNRGVALLGAEPRGALAPAEAAAQAELREALGAPFPLPVSALLEALPDGADRPEDDARLLGADLAPSRLVAQGLAPVVAILAPTGIALGLRPTVALADGELASLAPARGAALTGEILLDLEALLEAELDEETGGVPALIEAAERVAGVAREVFGLEAEEAPAVELVVDRDASPAAVARLGDSLHAAGLQATRFTAAPRPWSPWPVVVRRAPEELPEATSAGFERPIIVHLTGDGIHIWPPDGRVGDAPEGIGGAARPDGVAPGYLGTTLARLGVGLPEGGVGALDEETLARVTAAVAFWRAETGAGPVVHLAVGDGAPAAAVLRLAQHLQEGEGDALTEPQAIWPGAACVDVGPGACPSALVVAWSRIDVPSSRGVTDAPREARAPRPPPGPAASPDFCNERDIQVQMNRNRGQFRFCYESQLRVDDSLEGRVPVTFTIELDGSVRNVRVGQATLKNARVHECLTRNLSRMTFAKPDGGRCLVRWPFVFQRRE